MSGTRARNQMLKQEMLLVSSSLRAVQGFSCSVPTMDRNAQYLFLNISHDTGQGPSTVASLLSRSISEDDTARKVSESAQ